MAIQDYQILFDNEVLYKTVFDNEVLYKVIFDTELIKSTVNIIQYYQIIFDEE